MGLPHHFKIVQMKPLSSENFRGLGFHFWLCPAYKATILFIGKDAVVKETQN